MHRCFAERSSWQIDTVVLCPHESEHLVTVLRAKTGDKAMVFDGHGRVAPAEVVKALTRAAHLRFTAPAEQYPRPAPSITLIQAVPKGGHMDQIVEKATELGTAIIRPILTDRTVRRPRETQTDRWLRVAIGAAKQCGTLWVPAIHPVQSLRDALQNARANCDLILVGSLDANSQPIRHVLRESVANHPKRIGLLVGPEGDLSPEEHRLACSMGAVAVSFGRLVLRVETAALFGLSTLRYELGE
jgi:16S rRNA (uracil1498-N3)-methyltransferase